MPTLNDTGIVGLIHGSRSASFRALNAHLLVPKSVPIEAVPHIGESRPSKPRKSQGKATSVAPRARVKRTRNAETWTESRYWGQVRSALRQAFRWWKPALKALDAAKVKGNGKTLYLCCDCQKLFPRKEVEIDHVEPVGSLTSLDHLAGFLARLTPEDTAAFRVRCESCHQKKTQADRAARS